MTKDNLSNFKELKCENCKKLLCYYYGWNDGDITPYCEKCMLDKQAKELPKENSLLV